MSLYSTLTEPVRNEQLTVGTSSVIVSNSRNELNKRKTLLVRNVSGDGTIIYVNLGQTTAVLTTGIKLEDGESFSDSTGEGYEAYQGTFSAIATAATGSLLIM